MDAKTNKEMKESLLSRCLVEFNKQYLELYFSEGLQKKLKIKNNVSYFNILVNYVRQKRIDELLGKLNHYLGRANRLNDPVGEYMIDSDDADYAATRTAVVYTAVFGDKTPINEPLYVNKRYKYVIFTDHILDEDSSWEKRALPCEMPSGLNDAEKNRWLKLHPHILFPEYEYSIYVDGGIIIVGDMMPLVEGLGISILGSHRMSAPVDCVYESAKAVISSGKASKTDVQKQMEYYRKKGYPKHNGMFENGILVRHHMDEKCMKLMGDWWNQMEKYTMRDQMSLNYVLWKNGVKNEEIKIIGKSIFKNPRFRFYDLHL